MIMRASLISALVAVSGSALAQGPRTEGHLGDIRAGFVGGAVGVDTTVADNIKLCYGDSTCDWWQVYNTTGTQFELQHTSVDGGGADGVVLKCDDGTDDCTLSGVWTVLGNILALSDSGKICSGAAGTGDLCLYFDGTDGQLDCPTCTNGLQLNTPLVVGSIEVEPDSGQVTVMNQELSASCADGTAATLMMSLDSNNVLAPWVECNGSGSIDEIGVKSYGFNGTVELCTENQETLTFAADPGDASKTTTGLVPDGATNIKILARTLVLGTNCTSADYGDGSDVDLYGDNIALTAGTTVDPSDYTANINFNSFAGEEVTITGVGGNCFDLSVRVVAKYCTHTAPTN